jgi:Skp family chaperone for outer membrane proteins
MIIHTFPQGSEQWEQIRKGKATASRFCDIVTAKQLKLSKSAISYAAEIVAERLERERLQQEAEEKLRQQQAEIAAKEAALREEQRKLEEERQAREHAIRMEQERREAAENAARETEERIKREQAEAVERERQRQLEQERIAALRPDHEKLLEVADKVEALAGTVTVSKASIDLLSNVNKRIAGCAATIRHAVNQAMQNE